MYRIPLDKTSMYTRVQIYFAILLMTLLQLPCVATVGKVEQAANAYLRALQQAAPEARAAMRAQGAAILKDVEALKKLQKASYRNQVEAFVTEDIDPTAWNMVLERQRDTKAQTDALRDLRGQLVDTLQPTQVVLAEVGVKATPNETNAVTYYSSDEDEQPLSTQDMKVRGQLCKDIAQEVGY